ncbi:MAG TPA: response regulator [Nitrososphaeraceae archaeon]|nr:response regulator [Nitrososphaeraceae archaeon]
MSKDRSNANSNISRSSILLVDDDADISKLLEESLLRSGFKVSAFTDPIMALQDFKVNCKTCGLVLSDVRMPGMNGYELAKQAKQIDRDAKVVLMTAFEINEKEFQNLLPDIKIDGFIQKPFTLEKINELVKGIITRAN